MIETKIICDGCDEEIDPLTDYSMEFYLELRSVQKLNRSAVTYAMYKNHGIETVQFHGLNCLGLYYHKKV